MNLQQAWWTGREGNAYTERNANTPGRVEMFAKLLNVLPDKPETVVEIGANIGLNLNAIDRLINAHLIGVEPNDLARRQIGFQSLYGTAQDIPVDDNSADLVFTCGVLIHVPPDDLTEACEEIYRVSSKYIMCAEYFSDKPTMIPYHGKKDLLWKRDFGKYYLDLFPDLTVLDCSFFWRETTGLDNLTAWVFQK